MVKNKQKIDKYKQQKEEMHVEDLLCSKANTSNFTTPILPRSVMRSELSSTHRSPFIYEKSPKIEQPIQIEYNCPPLVQVRNSFPVEQSDSFYFNRTTQDEELPMIQQSNTYNLLDQYNKSSFT